VADLVFIQRSRLGRSIFHLRENRIEVELRNFGLRSSAVHPFRMISPDYTLAAKRVHFLYVVPLMFGAVSLFLIGVMLHHPLPASLNSLIIYPVIFTGLAVVGALRGFRRIEFFVFYDHWRKPLFYFVREIGQQTECDAFIQELLSRIEQSDREPDASGAETPPAPPERPSALVMPRDESINVFGPSQPRWLISVVCGLAAFEFSQFAARITDDPAIYFLVIMTTLVGALLFGALSFLAKERKRFFSLAGIVLGIAGPLLF
jgi:hypothetical protein